MSKRCIIMVIGQFCRKVVVIVQNCEVVQNVGLITGHHVLDLWMLNYIFYIPLQLFFSFFLELT